MEKAGLPRTGEASAIVTKDGTVLELEAESWRSALPHIAEEVEIVRELMAMQDSRQEVNAIIDASHTEIDVAVRKDKSNFVDELRNAAQGKEKEKQAQRGQEHEKKFPWAYRISQPDHIEAVSEDTEGYIRAAFPVLFLDGKFCPTERPRKDKVSFVDWCACFPAGWIP